MGYRKPPRAWFPKWNKKQKRTTYNLFRRGKSISWRGKNTRYMSKRSFKKRY